MGKEILNLRIVSANVNVNYDNIFSGCGMKNKKSSEWNCLEKIKYCFDKKNNKNFLFLLLSVINWCAT